MLPIFWNRSPRDQTKRRNETRQLVWSCDSSLKMIWISVPPFWSVNYRSIALGISGVASIFTVWSRWNVWCDTICFAWWLSFYLLTAVWWSELNKSRRDRFHSAILTAAILFSFLSRSYFVRFRLFVCLFVCLYFYFFLFFRFVFSFHAGCSLSIQSSRFQIGVFQFFISGRRLIWSPFCFGSLPFQVQPRWIRV